MVGLVPGHESPNTVRTMQMEYAVLYQRNLVVCMAFVLAVLYLFAYYIHMFYARRKVLALRLVTQRGMGLDTFLVVERWMDDLQHLTVAMTWLTIFNFSIFLVVTAMLYNDFLFNFIAAENIIHDSIKK